MIHELSIVGAARRWGRATAPRGGRSRARWVAAALALLLLAAGGAADTVHLNNGKSVEGVIDQSRSDERRVFIRTTNGTMQILRSKIKSIEMRENVSPTEMRGDLADQEGRIDEALELYLEAYVLNEPSEEILTKIEAMRAKIRAREEAKFEVQFTEIDAALEAGNFEQAITLADKLSREVGEGAARERCMKRLERAYVLQARDFRNKVNYPQAEHSYRRAIQSHRAAGRAQLELADMIGLYPAREREAFELYKEGIEMADADPTLIGESDLLRYRRLAADLHYKSSSYRGAADLYWRVSQDDKEGAYPRAFDSVIQSYSAIQNDLLEENQENETAMGRLETITRERPRDHRARILIGRIYYRSEDWESALPWLEQGLANMQGVATAGLITEIRYELAIVYRKQDRPQLAIARLIDVLEEQPGRYDAMCELGEVYMETVDYPNALARFLGAASLERASYRAYLGGGRTLRGLKRYEDALRQYERLFDLRDDHPLYMFEMGQLYALLDQLDEAQQAFENVIDLIEDKEEGVDWKLDEERLLADAYTHLGLAAVKQKKYFESIARFDKALEHYGDNPLAFDGKGQAYRELDMLDEAEEFFQKALQADPDNPSFLLNIGVLYHQFRQDTEQALQYYLAYYERGGTDPNVRQWIRECGGSPPSSP